MSEVISSWKFLPSIALRASEMIIVPRTMQDKGFSNFGSIFLVLYAIIDPVPRKRTLKTKYINVFELPQFKLLIIPMRN